MASAKSDIAVMPRSKGPVSAGAARPRGATSLASRATIASFGAIDVVRFARLARRLMPAGVTTLLYHRVDDPGRDGFAGLADLAVSRARFAEQLDHLVARANVVSLDEVLRWSRGEAELPRDAVLITFDDGYRDNYLNALPELEKRGLPATLFATTGFIDGTAWPWWDLVAEAFKRTKLVRARLPLLGERDWPGAEDRRRCVDAFVEACKLLDHAALTAAVEDLQDRLDVSVPPVPRDLFMDWDELRDLARRGVSVGAHTVSHPILTRVSPAQARDEIFASRSRLQNELGTPVEAFAYPNGSFFDLHKGFVQQAGYAIAFAATGGLTFAGGIRGEPFAVPRAGISSHDGPVRFGLKACGVQRLRAS